MITKSSFAPVDLAPLASYSNKLSISQVLSFFERQGVDMTRTMVQNYVRVGILPPLISKRYYSKKHIVFLALISVLKDTYSLDELKNLFAYLSAPKFDDNIMQAIYDSYITLYKATEESLSTIIKDIHIATKQTTQTLPYKDIDNKGIESANAFLSYLLVGSVGAAVKDIIKGEGHGQ